MHRVCCTAAAASTAHGILHGNAITLPHGLSNNCSLSSTPPHRSPSRLTCLWRALRRTGGWPSSAPSWWGAGQRSPWATWLCQRCHMTSCSAVRRYAGCIAAVRLCQRCLLTLLRRCGGVAAGIAGSAVGWTLDSSFTHGCWLCRCLHLASWQLHVAGC